MIADTEKEGLDKLSMPGECLNTYALALSYVDNAVSSHDDYWKLIKFCQEHIAGKKPISQEELTKKKMGWVWNYNFYKAKAKIEKGVAESTAKISSSMSLGYVTFRNFKDSDKKDEILKFLDDEQKRGMVASAIGYALFNTLSNETRLSGWVNNIEYPAYAFGWCALVFDKYDWMPDPIHPLDIAFKPNTRPEKIDAYITFKDVEASVLYERWVDCKNETTVYQESDTGKPKRIASSGWNLEGLEYVLLKAYRGKITQRNNSGEWERVAPASGFDDIKSEFIRDGSYVIGNTETVRIAKINIKELNGTKSEIYIPYGNAWQITTERKPIQQAVNTTQDTGGHILFTKNTGKQYKQADYIGLIRDSGFSETGCIQDYRGIAKFAVEDSIRYNRLRNGIGNKMTFVGSPMFESPTGQIADKFKVTVSQGFVLLPSSHSLIEKQPAFDIGSHINILRFEEGEYNRDTQQYDATIQGRLTSRPNKGEVQQVTAEVQFTDAAKNNIKFRDYASIFYQVLKRIKTVKCNQTDAGYDGKKAFYEKVKGMLPWLVKTDADVNKILDSIVTYSIDPVVTNIEVITIAVQMAETPFARNRLKRMMLVAKGLPIEEVNLAVPLMTDKFTSLQDDRVASFENDMFFTTNEVIISGTDDHIVHIESHLGKSQRVIEGAKQGAIPVMVAFKYLQNSIPHASNHIDILGADPLLNGKAKEYFDALKSFFVPEMKSMEQEVIRQQKQQEEQASRMQLDPLTEAEIVDKNIRTQSDLQRKDYIAQERARQREEQIKTNAELKMREQDLDAEIKSRQQ